MHYAGVPYYTTTGCLWLIMQAAASAHAASYKAGDPGQLLVDVTDSGEVTRHRRVERDGLAQMCHSQHYSKTPRMSDALPERPDRNGVRAQVQVWRLYASAHAPR